jgi:hypothetical protein
MAFVQTRNQEVVFRMVYRKESSFSDWRRGVAFVQTGRDVLSLFSLEERSCFVILAVRNCLVQN